MCQRRANYRNSWSAVLRRRLNLFGIQIRNESPANVVVQLKQRNLVAGQFEPRYARLQIVGSLVPIDVPAESHVLGARLASIRDAVHLDAVGAFQQNLM